uniref:Uncharacterized protein n=1 Tax=Panagrolaimus davidi TaxID=227884 RepID=A0A914QL23_9BILA
MGEKVVVCYDCENTNEALQGNCDSNQCGMIAGVKKDEGMASGRQNFLWFISTGFSRPFGENDEICESIVMKSPEAEVTFQTTPIKSCDPKKYDGKVIKLSVNGVKPGCPLFILNAKKWTPPLTTSPSTQNSSETTQITTAKSSNSDTTLWIGIGGGIFVLLIIFIVLGYCCYRTQSQKKPLFGKKNDVHQKTFVPEASKKAEVVKEKTADEEQVLKAKPTKVVAKPEPPKEATVVKEKQPKPSKEKTPKEKKAPIVEPKPPKEITHEDNPPPAKKVSVEPTVEAPTTQVSVVQKSVVQQKQYHNGNPPRVFVPESVIHPEPKSVNAPKSGSLKTGKKDSLSGRHEIGMEGLVHTAPEQVRRHDINVNLLNDEIKEKLENDDAMKALAERGVTFDEKSNIIEMPPKAEKYLRSKKTPEYVRSFAFGNVFREIIDAQTRVNESFSIPLLFSIVLQRRYTVVNRRKACTWIRRELPIIQKEFTAEECSKLAYPICAIEEACKMDAHGFESVFLLDSLSGADDDKTQNSPHASEKLDEKESDATKNGSKKRR